MTICYFMKFPDDWHATPKLSRTRSDIENVIIQQLHQISIKFDTAKLDRAREDYADKLWLDQLKLRKDGHAYDGSDRKFISREAFIHKNQQLIEREVYQKLLEDEKKDLYDKIEAFEIETLDEGKLANVVRLFNRYGVPDIDFVDALRKRQADITWERQFQDFYKTAKVTNSIPRGDRGTAKLIAKYPRMVRLRYYKGNDGQIRRTVEMDLVESMS